MGYQLFAGAAFALNKNRGICGRDVFDELVHLLDFGVFADDAAKFGYVS